MSNVVVPLISSILVALCPYFFSVFQHGKLLYTENLKELYKYFVAPIYYLLTSSYATTYVVLEIEKICESKSYLIPDTFLENFSIFKNDCKNTERQNTEFYKQIVTLNKFLRSELRYSKLNLNPNEKKIAKNYLGKIPTIFGAYSISIGISIVYFILAFFLYDFRPSIMINDVLYYVIQVALFIIMCIFCVLEISRYFKGEFLNTFYLSEE